MSRANRKGVRRWPAWYVAALRDRTAGVRR